MFVRVTQVKRACLRDGGKLGMEINYSDYRPRPPALRRPLSLCNIDTYRSSVYAWRGTELTRKHGTYSEQAATYDSRHAKMLERITAELRSRLDFIGVDWADDDEDEDEAKNHDDGTKPKKQVRMLDYACGTGMMSRVCILPDPSPTSAVVVFRLIPGILRPGYRR